MDAIPTALLGRTNTSTVAVHTHSHDENAASLRTNYRESRSCTYTNSFFLTACSLLLIACQPAINSPEQPRQPAPLTDTATPQDPADVPQGTSACPLFMPPHPSPASATTFTPGPWLGTVGYDMAAQCLILEDLDNDGRTDAIWIGIQDHDPHDAAPATHAAWGGAGPPYDHLPALPLSTRACLAHDVDGDGLLDIIATGSDHIVWMRQSEARHFSAPAVLLSEEQLEAREGATADWLTMVDLDREHGLDMIVTFVPPPEASCQFYLGEGNDNFYAELDDISASAYASCFKAAPSSEGVAFHPSPELCPDDFGEPSYRIFDAITHDINHDGYDDVILINDFGYNEVALGKAEGGLQRVTIPTGLSVYDHGMGGAIADFDGNGISDVYITDIGPDSLFAASTCTSWFEASSAWGTRDSTRGTVTWAVSAGDLDLNGRPDLLVTNSLSFGADDTFDLVLDEDTCFVFPTFQSKPPHIVLRVGPDGFHEADHVFDTIEYDVGRFEPVHMVLADVDDDGDLDAVVFHDHGTSLLRNDFERAGSWIEIVPLNKVGAPAVGARVIVEHEGGWRRMDEVRHRAGLNGHAPLRAHFGLGATTQPVHVSVRWPDGAVSRHGPFEPNQRIELHAP